jgi:PAS domain S-box-containing protein
VFAADHTVLYLKAADHQEAAIFLDSGQAPATLDRSLLDAFAANIAACFRNVKLFQHLLRSHREIDCQRSFLRAVIDADPHFVYVQDRRGRIALANRSLAASLDLTPEQMVGQTLPDRIAAPDFARALFGDDEALLAQRRDRIERDAPLTDQKGQTRWFHTVKLPLKNESSEIEHLIGFGNDITERKLLEAQLEKALAEKDALLVEIRSRRDP